MTRILLINSFFLCALLSLSLNAQTPEPILFGTYLASSDHPEVTYHRFNDSNLVKLGFNTIFQTVMHPVIHKSLFDTVSNIWWDNRTALANSSFNNIVAMNGNWNQVDPDLKEVDWVKILTHGVYNKWEAEGGSGDFYSYQIKMDCDSFYTDIFSIDGITGLVSAFGSVTDTSELPDGYTLPTSETVLVTGPGIYQDRTYKVVHRFDDHVIPYTANFRMRMGKKPIVTDSIPVCSLRVKIVYPKVYNNTVIGWDSTILAEKTIYSTRFDNNTFRNIEINYKINGLGKYVDMDFDYPYEGLDTVIAFNSSKVYYEVVIPLGVNPRQYGQLFIDNIIVMDDEIWKEHGSPVRIAELLNSYNNIWPVNDELNLYNEKIKFFYTMDEPHSYDHFFPYREVEAVQKTLSGSLRDKMMLTKIYPEWNGTKEGNNVIRTWNSVVKPRKSMFWYYTIFNQDSSTISGQIQLRSRFEEMVDDKTDFYFTAQTFGQRNLQTMGLPGENAHYYKYRTPTGREVLGQTMQALSYGCKGVFYETYYSYKSQDGIFVTPENPEGLYFAESLVGIDIIQYNVPRVYDYGLYDTIKSIGARLRGPLGRTLSHLEIDRNSQYVSSALVFYTPQGHESWDKIGGSLSIYGNDLLIYPPHTTHFINFGATKLKPKIDSKLKGSYYFLHNANTFDEVDLGTNGVYATYDTIKVGLRVTDFTNWVFQDIESGTKYRFLNTSATGFDLVQGIHLKKGDGRLFRLIPTVAWEGEFLTDEVITTGEIISSEGTITVPTGVTLKIEGNYTITDSLIIEDGGVLTLEPGSTLNLDSASSVYCAGDIYVNGTETNKVTINFLQPNESKQNSIYLGRESSAIIKYAQIKNGYSGITATNGFDTLIIDNCNFTNISHSALLLNGNGYDNAKIKNNTYTNCDYAGFFSNLATVAVNSDSANTTSGYYFSNVSNLWFGNNKLTGTQEGPGMTLTGCFGNIYNNKITDHTDGILLAHSFPKIGGNEITNNTQRGLVCEYGSSPDLKAFSEAGVCEQMNTYPLSGFNRISNNGTNAAEEGYEIFLDNSSIEMMNGTNEVSDPNYNPLILGKYMLERVDLSGNYWGTETIIERMFEIDNLITYSPVLTGFAPVISTDCPFVINLNTLSFTDTLHRINNGVIGTGGEKAERYMAEGEYDSAYSEFQSMSLISEDTTTINTEPLRGMYRSGKLGNNKETKLYQLTLKTDSLLTSVTDTNALKTLNRLKVYIEADNNNIPTAQLLAAQNTTNAITTTDQYHAQTEELTIALRGATLNRNMKNDVGSITTLNKSGMNNLMKRHGNKFTIKKEPKPVEIITEYSLSQNYPNPFNSSTIIEYALPKEGFVSIKLYDITGRLVKQLVNEQKSTGRYKTTIESGNMASGIYIYSLRVNDININKKLVILK